MLMRLLFTTLLYLGLYISTLGNIIDIFPPVGDASPLIREALNTAALSPEADTIRLHPGEYHLYRSTASKAVYYVSNTASEKENPDPTKHIGIWLKGLSNISIIGLDDATIITHGEMTTFVIDSCSNINFMGITVNAADPTVPEIKVIAVDSLSFTATIPAPSMFDVTDGRFKFVGEGWTLPDNGRLPGAQFICQVFHPDLNVTRRVSNPIFNCVSAIMLDPRTIKFQFMAPPVVKPGEIYQFRHSVRNEVCGLINHSKNICLENMRFHYMGNFGIVSQFSENINFESIYCVPDSSSERTAAGFADFLQLSNCRGNIRILNSIFCGSHDDPINIHGTHLKVTAKTGADRVSLRYMHPQTFGFHPCEAGDSIEFVNENTLVASFCSRVKAVDCTDKYNYEVILDDALPEDFIIDDMVVENISWTPSAEICGNVFCRTPTRAILISTRRPSVIANNLFFRIPMASILVSDDARSWYESGPVRNLTITGNTFYECNSPAILIKPEITRYDHPVHTGIKMQDNIFINQPQPIVTDRASEVTIGPNIFFENRRDQTPEQ